MHLTTTSAVLAITTLAAVSSVSAQTRVDANGCPVTQSTTFNRCLANFRSSGGQDGCRRFELPGNASQFPYYKCLCDVFASQAFCYNSFCPDNPLGASLTAEQARFCQLAGTTAQVNVTSLVGSGTPTETGAGDQPSLPAVTTTGVAQIPRAGSGASSELKGVGSMLSGLAVVALGALAFF
ncbi:hypothetical protein HDV05_007174 [Chytridiales sp. JEL 0842]|nr:hypothetical protein HDV05_007174 [Chytridiales sp. JEL 0842]